MARKEHPENDDQEIEWVDTDPVIVEVYPSTSGGAGSGVSHGAGMSGASFTASTTEPSPTETDQSPSTSGSGFDGRELGSSPGQDTKKHAWCESHPATLGWRGPTRTGADAQSVAQGDADQHNASYAGHQAVVFDGVGADT